MMNQQGAEGQRALEEFFARLMEHEILTFEVNWKAGIRELFADETDPPYSEHRKFTATGFDTVTFTAQIRRRRVHPAPDPS